MNCVVLQIKRTWPGDINCIAFKSIENSNVLEKLFFIIIKYIFRLILLLKS